MLLLGLDFETVGGELGGVPELSYIRVIEVGMALWSVEKQRPARQSNFLVRPEKQFTDKEWADMSTVHGITKDMTNEWGIHETSAVKSIMYYYNQADAVVAHNGTLFDKPLFMLWAEREKIELPSRVWIDTRLDVPNPMKGRLAHIAADHGFLNPFPHQALSDVLTMLRILDTYDIPTVIKRAKIPSVLVEALVSFAQKDEAKDRGYYWHPFKKKGGQWLKAMKECDVAKEREEAPFDVQVGVQERDA